MLNLWQPKQLLEEIKDPAATGAAPVVPPTPSAKDLGYEDEPAAPVVPPVVPPVKAVEPEKPVEITDPATGYGKEIPEEEVPPGTPPVVDPKDVEIEKHLGELPKEDVEKIKAFAKANEMTEKQLKAYGELRRQQLKDQEGLIAKRAEEKEKQKTQVHREWQQELKKDPVFGGDNFQANVTQVERLVQDFMPEYKKRLTESKGMMPPYIMRDLAKLAKSLYKTETLVHGNPPTPPEEKKKDEVTLEDMYN